MDSYIASVYINVSLKTRRLMYTRYNNTCRCFVTQKKTQACIRVVYNTVTGTRGDYVR